MFLKFIGWSSKIMVEEENQFSLFRKAVILKLTSHLFDVLKSYFVTFTSFFFDFFLEQLDHYATIYADQAKKLRKHLTNNDLKAYQETTLHQ